MIKERQRGTTIASTRITMMIVLITFLFFLSYQLNILIPFLPDHPAFTQSKAAFS